MGKYVFGNREIMRGGPPRAVSAERVAFLQLHMCIIGKYVFGKLSIFEKLKIILEKSLNFDLIKLYEP